MTKAISSGGSRAGYATYAADEELHRRTATERIARLTAALGPGARPGSLVEIGSATGFGLLEAQRAGWQAVGVEISEWAGNRARERGANVVHTLEEVPDAPNDAVAFFQSLEHLPDPVAALKRSAELLRPGGVLVCETWDARSRTARLTGSRWQQLSPPSVLWLFTEQAIRAAVEPWGLELAPDGQEREPRHCGGPVPSRWKPGKVLAGRAPGSRRHPLPAGRPRHLHRRPPLLMTN